MSTLLFLTTCLLFGVCLRASGSLRDLLAVSQISNLKSESPLASLRPLRSTLFSTPSTPSTGSTGSTPSTAPDASVSVRACPRPTAPSPAPSSQISNFKSEIPDPRCLFPEPLVDALETLTDELRHRLALYEGLAPFVAVRRARRDARFAVRLRAIHVTLDRVCRVDPHARPVDPAGFLPALTATELARSEKFLAELTRAWRIYGAHPSAAELDRALTALSRITALRRSLFQLDRLAPRPDAFPGWDADRHLNPFDETFEPIFPDGFDRPSFLPADTVPLTPTELLERLLAPLRSASNTSAAPSAEPPRESPSAGSASSSNPLPPSEPLASYLAQSSDWPRAASHPSTPSPSSTGSTPVSSRPWRPSHVFPRRPRSLACIPRWLLRLVRRYGAWLLYLRPHHLNPVIRKLARLAGLIALYFPPPDAPPEKMSEAEAAWWRAEQDRRIRIVFRPEVEGRQRGIPPTSLPPWGFDDPPWET